MATRVIDDSKLQNIAVAIQNKDSGGQMTVDEMPTRIEQNLQSKAVLDSLIDGSITSIESDATGIRGWGLYELSQLVSAYFPNATIAGDAAFRGCSNIKTIILDKARSIGLSAFYNCYSLENINIRNVERFSQSAFFNCKNLNTIVLEKRALLDSINVFQNCPAIIYVKPEDLSWYSTATNWSTLYAQDRIKSIEDLTGDDLAWYQEQLARYQAA